MSQGLTKAAVRGLLDGAAYQLLGAAIEMQEHLRDAAADGKVTGAEARDIGVSVSDAVGDMRIVVNGTDVLTDAAQDAILGGVGRVVNQVHKAYQGRDGKAPDAFRVALSGLGVLKHLLGSTDDLYGLILAGLEGDLIDLLDADGAEVIGRTLADSLGNVRLVLWGRDILHSPAQREILGGFARITFAAISAART